MTEQPAKPPRGGRQELFRVLDMLEEVHYQAQIVGLLVGPEVAAQQPHLGVVQGGQVERMGSNVVAGQRAGNAARREQSAEVRHDARRTAPDLGHAHRFAGTHRGEHVVVEQPGEVACFPGTVVLVPPRVVRSVPAVLVHARRHSGASLRRNQAALGMAGSSMNAAALRQLGDTALEATRRH